MRWKYLVFNFSFDHAKVNKVFNLFVIKYAELMQPSVKLYVLISKRV